MVHAFVLHRLELEHFSAVFIVQAVRLDFVQGPEFVGSGQRRADEKHLRADLDQPRRLTHVTLAVLQGETEGFLVLGSRQLRNTQIVSDLVEKARLLQCKALLDPRYTCLVEVLGHLLH